MRLNTLQCFEHKGQEIIILQDIDTELFAVDIRADNYGGDLIMGYCDLMTENEAMSLAMGFVDSFSIENNKNVKIKAFLRKLYDEKNQQYNNSPFDCTPCAYMDALEDIENFIKALSDKG